MLFVLAGIKELLNDPTLTGVALQLDNHGLVSPLDAGKARTAEELPHSPSYVRIFDKKPASHGTTAGKFIAAIARA